MSLRAAVAACILVLVGVLAAAAGRQLVLGSRAISECDVARARGEHMTAILAAKRAAEAHVPFSSHSTAGYVRLRDMAHDAERRTDEASAAAAWRSMRSASLATRGIGAGGGDWRTMAEDGLVRVAAQRTSAGELGNEVTLRAALSVDDTPPTWSFVAIGGTTLIFLFGAARLLLHARRTDKTPRR